MRGVARIALVAVLLNAGCTSGKGPAGEAAAPRAGEVATGDVSGPLPSRPEDAYAAAIDSAARRGLQVWVEADLLKRWLEGPASFDEAVRRVAELARRPGVVGIKVADELGYRDATAGQPARARQFLRDTRAALHERAPQARLLVDLLVPELGCASGLGPASEASACTTTAREKHPGLSLPDIDALLATRAVDAVDLSTGLLSAASYRARGLDRDQAQVAAWQEVQRRGWADLVQLRARKALAHSGRYPGSVADAEADLRTWVDLPRQQGAAAVDIWTWRQTYRDDVVQIMDAGLLPNPLYEGLVRRRSEGARLVTHLTPSSLEHGLEAEMDALAQAFSEVFIASGTG